MTDDTVSLFAQNNSQLKTVYLSGCDKLTSSSLQRLAYVFTYVVMSKRGRGEQNGEREMSERGSAREREREREGEEGVGG